MSGEATALQRASSQVPGRPRSVRVTDRTELDRLRADLTDAQRMIALLVWEAGGEVLVTFQKQAAISGSTVITRWTDHGRGGDVITISGHET